MTTKHKNKHKTKKIHDKMINKHREIDTQIMTILPLSNSPTLVPFSSPTRRKHKPKKNLDSTIYKLSFQSEISENHNNCSLWYQTKSKIILKSIYSDSINTLVCVFFVIDIGVYSMYAS